MRFAAGADRAHNTVPRFLYRDYLLGEFSGKLRANGQHGPCNGENTRPVSMFCISLFLSCELGRAGDRPHGLQDSTRVEWVSCAIDGRFMTRSESEDVMFLRCGSRAPSLAKSWTCHP